MTTTGDIVAKLWSLCHVLRDDGVTYNEYVTELTFLLFLKMLEETKKEDRLVSSAGHPLTLVRLFRRATEALNGGSGADFGDHCLPSLQSEIAHPGRQARDS
jgi:hypothetical protein